MTQVSCADGEGALRGTMSRLEEWGRRWIARRGRAFLYGFDWRGYGGSRAAGG